MDLVRAIRQPCGDAVEQGDGVWLVQSAEDAAGATPITDCRPEVEPRWDLVEGHPIRGRRALLAVLAGMPDVLVDAAGRLTTDVTASPIEAVEVEP